MRMQRVVCVLAEAGHGGAAPVLKDVQVGSSLVLQQEHGDGGECEERWRNKRTLLLATQ